MTTYVIMCNIIVKNECDDNLCSQEWDFQDELIEPTAGPFQQFVHVHHKIRDRATHTDIKKIWLSICALVSEASSLLLSFYMILFDLYSLRFKI
jgi:hypothetical protein